MDQYQDQEQDQEKDQEVTYKQGDHMKQEWDWYTSENLSGAIPHMLSLPNFGKSDTLYI